MCEGFVNNKTVKNIFFFIFKFLNTIVTNTDVRLLATLVKNTTAIFIIIDS